MATTLVISPTTNTMLKIVLYSGYLKPSFLMQSELFELFSAPWVKLEGVLLYILTDKEWMDEGCLLCNSYLMKGLPWTMNSPWMESKAQNSPWWIRPFAQSFLSNTCVPVREQCCTWSTWFPPLSWCSYFGGYLMLKSPLPGDREIQAGVSSPPPAPSPNQAAPRKLLTQINQSHKCVSFSLMKSSTTTSCWVQKKERWHIHIHVH